MFPPCPRKVLDIYFPAQTGLCEYPLTFSGHTSQAAYNKQKITSRLGFRQGSIRWTYLEDVLCPVSTPSLMIYLLSCRLWQRLTSNKSSE